MSVKAYYLDRAFRDTMGDTGRVTQFYVPGLGTIEQHAFFQEPLSWKCAEFIPEERADVERNILAEGEKRKNGQYVSKGACNDEIKKFIHLAKITGKDVQKVYQFCCSIGLIEEDDSGTNEHESARASGIYAFEIYSVETDLTDQNGRRTERIMSVYIPGIGAMRAKAEYSNLTTRFIPEGPSAVGAVNSIKEIIADNDRSDNGFNECVRTMMEEIELGDGVLEPLYALARKHQQTGLEVEAIIKSASARTKATEWGLIGSMAGLIPKHLSLGLESEEKFRSSDSFIQKMIGPVKPA